MRISTLALAGAFGLIASAALADDPMANTYANTITTKSQKTGQSGTLLFNADGTYITKATGADGKPVQIPGKWSLKDDGKTICLTPQLPPNTPNPPGTSCSPLQMHAVGESWSVTNDQGEAFTVSLSAGR
ncbi:MAG: hypothetical protein JOZ13_16930 [Alphaproteobacteria bacterium]|nr:hypothetical protein [Alphaproteobacteria bacterium]